jgi:hypothetical protein
MRQAWLLAAGAALFCACGGDDDGASDEWGPVSGAPALLAVTDVWAFSPTDVWFLDGSATVHRYDGAAWATLETPATGGLACIFALSPSDVWLCAGTQVLHYDGADFTATEVTSATGLDGLSSLWASSSTDLWAVGDDAIVAHGDGTGWTGTITGSPFKSSIWGSGPDDVYALSTFELMHFDGEAWSEVLLEGGAGDGQVWGTGAADVWVMTDSSQLGHFDGASWQAVETADFVGDLAAVWGPAPDDLWAAGGAGAIAHYDGESWDQLAHQEIGAPFLRQFVAVHGTSSADVWIVGQELGESGSTGLIYHRRP